MSGGAHVGSIEAVREMRTALAVFLHEAREALLSQDLELRRTLDWLLDVQPHEWKHRLKQCEDGVTQAKIDLERARSCPKPGGGEPSCTEEKKGLERARRRRDYAEEKIDSVRRWGGNVQREAEEYMGRATQLLGLLDAELPQALAFLDRVLGSLDAYVGVAPPEGGTASGATTTGISFATASSVSTTSEGDSPGQVEPAPPVPASAEERNGLDSRPRFLCEPND